jgi:hypothetical protein
MNGTNGKANSAYALGLTTSDVPENLMLWNRSSCQKNSDLDYKNYALLRKAGLSTMSDGLVTKLAMSLPWLARYPFWRASELVRRFTEDVGVVHLILVVANHFEPGYNDEPNGFGGFGITLDWTTQQSRLDKWCSQARAIGKAVRDHDNTPFRHTNFYPAEQYHRGLLDQLSALQAEGYGEVEIHLHHGVDQPDTAEGFRSVLVGFRDALVEHKCLSRESEYGPAKYAFVHGNWALANSARGQWCGVDSEMQILAETGCYADLTLPSAPHVSQVPRINAVYNCGHDLKLSRPHRSGRQLRVGERPELPIIFTGPLILDWGRRKLGFVPTLDNSALTAKYPGTPARLDRWRQARIGVLGRPDWVFIKLYCHGFFDADQSAVIGDAMRKFLEESLELAERTGRFKLHFATAREAFNMITAATSGETGPPGLYRDFRLLEIMRSEMAATARPEPVGCS